ncbi:MAG: flagellar motor protein [Burkholderiaceae bacterium]
MDWASLAGLALALAGILGGQLIEGGRLDSLIQPAAFIIVFVGTFGAVLLQSGWPNFLHGLKMVQLVFKRAPDSYQALAHDIGLWSVTGRREGLLSLERYLEVASDPFIAKGLRMLIDGIDSTKIREILDTEISNHEGSERQAIKIWEAAGGYSPTIGILGAVLGLIHVMENLVDPSRLGSGIAVAFVATIYGVGLANLVFLPIANKLKSIMGKELTKREMIAEALVAIASGDNPRVIEERISAYQGKF